MYYGEMIKHIIMQVLQLQTFMQSFKNLIDLPKDDIR